MALLDIDNWGDNSGVTGVGTLIFILLLGISSITSQYFIVVAFGLTLRAIWKKLPMTGWVVFWIFVLPVIILACNVDSYGWFNYGLAFYAPILNLVFVFTKKWSDKKMLQQQSNPNTQI
jgi:hypothetical protein